MSATPPPSDAVPQVVVVCTANVARSPLLEVRLQAEADRRLGTGRVEVSSAGTQARIGDPAAAGSQAVAARWGLDLTAHFSKSLDYSPLSTGTLVLTTTRSQKRALNARFAGVADRVFTVAELLAALDAAGADLPAAPETGEVGPLRAHLEAALAVADAHRPRPLPWRARQLDLADPIGGDQAVYDQLGVWVDDACTRLGAALFGPAR